MGEKDSCLPDSKQLLWNPRISAQSGKSEPEA
jgi:hypothetical protein